MRLIEGHLQNFMGIGEARFSLDTKGLVLLQGVNEDDPSALSNGASKSSLADGIFWCAYGETAREKMSADEVVNSTAKKDCFARTLWEEDDGGRYEIFRWRKMNVGGKRSGVSLKYTDTTGETVDLTKGTDKLTQVEIDKALGCTSDVFTAAVYAGQEKLPNLPAMSDGELKKLIEEASGVTVLVRAYEIARQKLKDIEREQDTWRVDHVRAEREIGGIQARKVDLTTRRDSYEERRKIDLAALRDKLESAVARARTAKVQRDEIDEDAAKKGIETLDAKIEAVESETVEENRLSNLFMEAKGKHVTVRSTFERAVTDAKAQKATVDKIDEKVGSPCGECGKPYGHEDLGDARKIAEERLRILVTRAKELGEDVKEAHAEETAAKTALEAFRASRTDIRATVEERKRFATLLVTRRDAAKTYEHETATAKDVREQFDNLKAEKNPFISVVEGVERELNEALAAFRTSEEKGAEIERRLLVAKDVVKVFGPAGVRAHVLDTVTPYLNDRTSDYLGTLSDGRITAVWSTLSLDSKGELKENFSINVEKVDAAESFASLSGGEKRKVRIACALALQDLVATRATKPIRLWIGDEIDDALDDAGLERLMTVLEMKARERGTVLVISHNALNDWIRDTATMTMKGGRSTLSGVIELPTAPVALAA